MRNNFTTQRGLGDYRIEINAEASLRCKGMDEKTIRK